MNHLQTEKPLCLMPGQRSILLSRHFVWRDLSTDELLALSQTIQERFYNAEEVVVREGDSAENLYYIIKGSVLVTTKQNEKNVILSTLGSEEMFGGIGLAYLRWSPFSDSKNNFQHIAVGNHTGYFRSISYPKT